MSFGFLTQGVIPGMSDTRFSSETEVGFGPWEHNRAFVIPGLILGTTRGASAPGTLDSVYLKGGSLLGLVTASNKLTIYDPGATGLGNDTIYGILLQTLKMGDMADGDPDKWVPVLIGGNVKSSQLVHNDDAANIAPGGWIGGADETAIRTALQDKRFILDDFTGS